MNDLDTVFFARAWAILLPVLLTALVVVFIMIICVIGDIGVDFVE
jgi:hypothetical protein